MTSPTIEEMQAKLATANANPSVEPGKAAAERRRIPMSVPQRRLEMPDIPGYHTQWIFDGTPGRVQQAIDAGFEFVDRNEVTGNSVNLGSDSLDGASTDLGSRVSIGEGGGRLYFMKQKLEYYREDQLHAQKRNDQVRDALVAGQFGESPNETPADKAARFLDPVRSSGIPELFKRKIPKGAT